MPRLVWTEGEARHSHDLAGPISFGRGAENAVRLNDPNVSREHGRLEPDGRGGWQLVDRGSANGIFVAGRRVDHLALTDGVEFTAGDARFRFEWPESAEATTLLGPAAPTRIAAPAAPPAAPAAVLPARSRAIPVLLAIGLALLVAGLAFRLGRGSSPAVVPPAPADAAVAAAGTAEGNAPPSAAAVPAPGGGAIAAPATSNAPASELSAADAAAERERLATEIARQLSAEQARQREAERQQEAAAAAQRQRERLARLERELTSESYGTRWQAYEELRGLGRRVDPVPLWLLDLKLHPDDDVREAAAEKLGRAQDRRAIRQLRWSAQYDDDFGVRGESEDALEAMGIQVD